MRNWNSALVVRYTQICGFQTTYEELKLPISTINKNSDLRFQTTYEELKLTDFSSQILILASRLPMRNWNSQVFSPDTRTVQSFQTTYEELKLSSRSVVRHNKVLPDYLWGIETSRVRKCFCLCFELPDYLWGIETFSLFHDVAQASCASRLPMRNWNPRLLQPTIQPESFQTTYEELKHHLWLRAMI